MLKIIIVVIVLVVAAVLVYAATKPDTFKVQRSIAINAPPEKVFALINNFRLWPSWSPYEKLDPAMKKAFSGSPTGTGAIYEWSGNNKAGSGRIAITAATPSQISMKLDMFKPMEGHNDVEFMLRPNGTVTDVSWTMQGASSYLSKVMIALGIMDKMVGGQFEEGLANLKRVAESS